MNANHIPVLLEEVLTALSVKPKSSYIDATFGFGGHALAIEKQGGRVLGIEQDQETINKVQKILDSKNIMLTQGNFRNLEKISISKGFDQVDGVLFDLGYSTWQLDKAGRGISFQKNEVLDMRLDKEIEVTAGDVVNNSSSEELEYILKRYGEEDKAEEIVDQIVKSRPIESSKELKDCIYACVPEQEIRLHSARVFQALRIVVNDELEALKQALPQACKLLKPKGMLCVISFHSLEDRLVKQYIRNNMKLKQVSSIRPTQTELKRNSRAMSARLRIAEKL